MARLPVEDLIERSKMALAKITAAMARNDPPPWPYVARIFFAPPKTWPTGPIAARDRELGWLVRHYGPPMPRGPLQSVRPVTRLGAVAGCLTGALAKLMGGSDEQADRIALRSMHEWAWSRVCRGDWREDHEPSIQDLKVKIVPKVAR